MLELPQGWLAPNVERLYPNVETPQQFVFKRIAYHQLPPLATADGSFDWLPPLPAGSRPTPLVFDDGEEITENAPAVARHVAKIADQARAQALELPASFVTFTSSSAFAAQIMSVVGGYFEVGELECLPHGDGPERLVRFFLDPQTFVWALLLEPGGHRVVFGSPDASGAFELTEITTCAPSFEMFIKRFWIEHATAYALLEGHAIDGELRAYLEATVATGR